MERLKFFYECGCCGHYHRADFFGDCRDDAERFTTDQVEQEVGDKWDELVEEVEA